MRFNFVKLFLLKSPLFIFAKFFSPSDRTYLLVSFHEKITLKMAKVSHTAFLLCGVEFVTCKWKFKGRKWSSASLINRIDVPVRYGIDVKVSFCKLQKQKNLLSRSLRVS